MIKGYKTSKDYKHLKELLDSGCKVIVLIGQKWLGYAQKEDDTKNYYIVGNIGIVYYDERQFVTDCAHDEIEFIDPTEE